MRTERMASALGAGVKTGLSDALGQLLRASNRQDADAVLNAFRTAESAGDVKTMNSIVNEAASKGQPSPESARIQEALKKSIAKLGPAESTKIIGEGVTWGNKHLTQVEFVKFNDALQNIVKGINVSENLKTIRNLRTVGKKSGEVARQLDDILKRAEAIGSKQAIYTESVINRMVDEEIAKETLEIADEMSSPAVKTVVKNKVNEAARLYPMLKAVKSNPAASVSAKALNEFADSASTSQVSALVAHSRNPDVKNTLLTRIGAKLGVQVQKLPNAVNNTFSKQKAGVAKVQNEVLSPRNTPSDVVEKSMYAELLKLIKSLKTDQRVAWAVGAAGIAVAVVSTVVSIFVKPPYWNDDAVLDGTGGAKPGAEQSAVNAINWVNENPGAVTSSSCMSCICCCCCCLLLIMAMSGGKKSGNNTNF